MVGVEEDAGGAPTVGPVCTEGVSVGDGVADATEGVKVGTSVIEAIGVMVGGSIPNTEGTTVAVDGDVVGV